MHPLAGHIAALCFWVSLGAFGGPAFVFYAAFEEARAEMEVLQQIHSFIDQLKMRPVIDLPEDDKQEAIGHLNTLDHQCMLKPDRRDWSKIVTALERLPALCSGVATCLEAWQKVEAVVKPHLGL